MKAAQFKSYGGPDVIDINTNAPEPTLKDGQILVDNYAASINPIDYKVREGYMQKITPLSFPATIGGDFAGKVVKVSESVKEFKTGDNVYGQAIVLNGGSGTMAEFVAANAKNTALKPETANFEEAGALPLAGVSALQGIADHINLQQDQKILIHGGAGGIGHIAIQLAKSFGAYVATTVKKEDFDFVRKLGADEVIDYKSQQFEGILKDYDAVFDTVGGEITHKSFMVLKPGGIIVSMIQPMDQELARKHNVTAILQGTKTNTEHLKHLAELVDAGRIKVFIDKIYPLEQVRQAYSYQEKQPSVGKVVVKIK